MQDNRVPDRIWDKIFPEPNTGCWLWGGSLAGSSHLGMYGQTWFNGRKVMTHRFLYEKLVGPIPSGLDLDHKCRVRCCCNPAHLEPVTRSENNKRGLVGNNRIKEAAELATCKNGHKWDAENTLYSKRGHRVCRTCKNWRLQLYRRMK